MNKRPWAPACGTTAIGITAVTKSGHVTSSVTSPFDSSWPLSYRLPRVNNPVSPVVSEIFCVKKRHALPPYQTPPRYAPQPYGWRKGDGVLSRNAHQSEPIKVENEILRSSKIVCKRFASEIHRSYESAAWKVVSTDRLNVSATEADWHRWVM